VLTLLVNMNPLMRFDGYYILSDALDEPNLQDTSFRIARWHMRMHALGLREPPPTHHTGPRRRLLVAYAYATWIYRLFLFLGIAFLVYTMAFKLLGILLALVEVGWFIVRPVAAEVRLLWARRRELRPNLAMVRSAACVVAGALIMAVPWRGTVHGDALVGAERRAMLYAPAPSQVVEVAAAPGMYVAEGQPLFRLSAPQLDHDAGQLRRTVDALTSQIGALSGQQDSSARATLLTLERETVRQRLAGVEAAIAQLDLRAPFVGEVVELADPLQRLEWVERGEPLALVVDRSSTLAEALVSEQDLHRIAVGSHAMVRPRNPDLAAIPATVEAIDTSALRVLHDPALASTRGGPIAAREDRNGTTVPEIPVYRVRLRPTASVTLDRMELATVRIDATAESLAARLWRNLWGGVLRESGF
jgi:putative peptide zinc metalloprotease protein